MTDEKIINLGIVAHVDAGKTTLTEQLLYCSGELRKKGSVDSGTAQTDWLAVERARGISVKASSVRLSRENCHINLIDTPGHVDFASEVERSLQVLDCAVLVISAVEGIQAQTEILLDALTQTKTPTILLINKIDRAGSDTDGLVKELKEERRLPVLPFSTVIKQGGRDCEVRQRGFTNRDFFEECILALSESDPALLEEYLAGEVVSTQSLDKKLRAALSEALVMPVLCASASLGVGVKELLEFIIRFVNGACLTNEELSAIVYKIEHDEKMGKIAHVRLFGGTIRTRDSIQIPASEESQKVTQIRRVFGGRFTDIGEVKSGDIAALCGLSSLKIGDVIGKRGDWRSCKLAVPLLKVQVSPRQSGDLPALLTALGELCEEDPLLDMEYIREEQEIQIKITGPIQLEILSSLLKERYSLEATFSSPTVIYKESPLKAAEGFEAYTMPKPCWAVVRLKMEPGERGSGLEYHSIVSNDDIYLRYQNHIRTSVQETLRQGLYGWEVTDLRVTLVGGEHHIVHTHPMDFFVATPMAVMNALVNAGTTLLEPMVEMRISAQEEYLGKIIGDILLMRGEFESPVVHGGSFKVTATVPVATSLDYPIKLGILTSGRAVISTRFSGYKECPPELGSVTKRRGVDPLDRAKWILSKRNAL